MNGFILLAMIDIVNYKLTIRRKVPTRNSQEPVHNLFLFITVPRLLLSYVVYWSYASGIYYYLCNQCLSSPTWWFRTTLMWGVLDKTLCDEVCQWLATGRQFWSGIPLSSINKTNRRDITEILWNRVNHKNPNPKPNYQIIWTCSFRGDDFY